MREGLAEYTDRCVCYLRQLLDEQLGEALEETSLDVFGKGNVVLEAMLALLTREGFAG